MVSMNMSEYRLPIYKEWDKQNRPCPHNKNGWVAWHKELVTEEFLKNYSEDKLDNKDNQ